MSRKQYSDEQRTKVTALARKVGAARAARDTGVAQRTISDWLAADAKPQVREHKKTIPPEIVADRVHGMRWRGEKFRLVKDHSLLRYFIVRREDVNSLPVFCTVEHLFTDGRHAIHDRELVVSARLLRFHPSYLRRIADFHICDLRGSFARIVLLESGLLKADDDYQLVDLILAMVERDRRRDRQEQSEDE